MMFPRVIEVGLRNFFMGPGETVPGRPGLLLVDMAAAPAAVTDRYYFPEDVVSPTSSFLNDIVVDEAREVAYLSDADGDGALITFDYRSRRSHRYSGPSTRNEPAYSMVIAGVNYGRRVFTTPVDGIAMGAGGEYVYYCAVQGTQLYRVATAALRDFSASSQAVVDAAVQSLGVKPPSDGIVVWGDALYFGSLPESTFYGLTIPESPSANMTSAAVSIPSDPVAMQWVCMPALPALPALIHYGHDMTT
jgi:hypothetical protein